MKIERINDNQIRCTLTREDFINRELKLSELAYGTEKVKTLFKDMMQKAAFELGFEADNIPLMIEAIPLSPECIILIITKVDDPEELDTRFSKFAPNSSSEEANNHWGNYYEGADDILGMFKKLHESKLSESSKEQSDSPTVKNSDLSEDKLKDYTRLYVFDDLDTVIDVSHILKDSYNGRSTLYKNRQTHKYLLVIGKSNHSPEEFNKVCNILSEYATSANYSKATEGFLLEHEDVIIPKNAVQNLATIS